MKVLTIKQPWATLIMQKDKRFEFRSWQTKYRGDLLIHAGKGIDKEAMKRLEKYIPSDINTFKAILLVIIPNNKLKLLKITYINILVKIITYIYWSKFIVSMFWEKLLYLIASNE